MQVAVEAKPEAAGERSAAPTANMRAPGQLGPAVQVALGYGVSLTTFVEVAIMFGIMVFVRSSNPTVDRGLELVSTPEGSVLVLAILFWVAPLRQLAYLIDRIGAIRSQVLNLAPYGLDLLPTLPDMLPHLPKIINHIEEIGPFIPVCMQKGCKEYLLPIMPLMMDDLEAMLPHLDVLAPVLPKMAPHMIDVLPYTKEMLPYIEQLLPILEVDVWYKVNPYLGVIVPHISKVAPHSKVMAKHLPAMVPFLPILAKHMDKLMDQFDETIEVMDDVIPLLPLLPAADKAGLLDQKIAFSALPHLVGFVPLSNENTEKAALKAAVLHTKLVEKAENVKERLVHRYKELVFGSPNTPKAIEDIQTPPAVSRQPSACSTLEQKDD
mmetsp:Transcript_3163/g.6005  ORF Transcript_3163/g.6005 Transcript_3163/m.6005 type:complete len:380 (+) Transcript_3163:293-1432(+)